MLPYICIRVNTYASFRQRRQKRSPSPRQIAARCCIIAAYQRRIPPLRAFLRRFARPAFFNTTLLSENDAQPTTVESHLYLYAIPVPDSESRTIPNHSSEDEKPPREQGYRALGGTYLGGRHAPRRQNQPTAARSGLHRNARSKMSWARRREALGQLTTFATFRFAHPNPTTAARHIRWHFLHSRASIVRWRGDGEFSPGTPPTARCSVTAQTQAADEERAGKRGNVRHRQNDSREGGEESAASYVHSLNHCLGHASG